MIFLRNFVVTIFLISSLSACQNAGSLLKSDIDSITEGYQQRSITHLKTLLNKLYLRNPKELQKNDYSKVDIERLTLIDLHHQPALKILNNTRSIESIYIAFDEDYQGDRVFAFVYGLSSMLMDAYRNQTSFSIMDSQLNAQSFYNLARNFEIANWMLNNKLDARGKPLIYSNSLKNEKTRNLSFERLFGKLISEQDSIAKTFEIYYHQHITTMIVNIASSLLLPI